MTTNLRSDRIKTRKPHECWVCYRVIPKGSLAQSWAVLDERSFFSGYFCDDCQNFNEDCAYDEGIMEGECACQPYAKLPINNNAPIAANATDEARK